MKSIINFINKVINKMAIFRSMPAKISILEARIAHLERQNQNIVDLYKLYQISDSKLNLILAEKSEK